MNLAMNFTVLGTIIKQLLRAIISEVSCPLDFEADSRQNVTLSYSLILCLLAWHQGNTFSTTRVLKYQVPSFTWSRIQHFILPAEYITILQGNNSLRTETMSRYVFVSATLVTL